MRKDFEKITPIEFNNVARRNEIILFVQLYTIGYFMSKLDANMWRYYFICNTLYALYTLLGNVFDN